jgi:hypothetical protein
LVADPIASELANGGVRFVPVDALQRVWLLFMSGRILYLQIRIFCMTRGTRQATPKNHYRDDSMSLDIQCVLMFNGLIVPFTVNGEPGNTGGKQL